MDTYLIKMEIKAEVEAFNEEDAREYISDIFGIDEEIKSIKVISIQKKSWHAPNFYGIIRLSLTPYGGIGKCSKY